MSKKVINIAIISVAAVGFAFGLRYWIRHSWTCTVLKTQEYPSKVHVSDLQFADGTHSFTAMVIRIPHEAYKARLINIELGQTLASRLAAKSSVVINAGYFDESKNPLGLIRINGIERGKLLDQSPLSGIVAIDSKGAIRLVPRVLVEEIKNDPDAFQAGPFLINVGGTMGIKSDDGQAVERTVLVYDRSCIEIIITSPVTLFQLADCINRNKEDFDLYNIQSALNLDGGPSTGYAANFSGKSMSAEPRGPVANAIVFDLK